MFSGYIWSYEHIGKRIKLLRGREVTNLASKYARLVWRSKFWHILVNISGPAAYFCDETVSSSWSF